MFVFPTLVPTLLQSATAPAALMAYLVKCLILLSVAAGAAKLLGRRSAATRHVVWKAGIVGTLVLPLLPPVTTHLVPSMELRLPVVTTLDRPVTIPMETAPSTAHADDVADHLAPTEPAPPTGLTPEPAPRRGLRAVPWLLGLWASGVLVVLLRLIAGLAGMWWLGRSNRVLRDDTWRRATAELCRALDVKQAPRLLMSPRIVTPMTCGVLRPSIVLPATAMTWPLDRRRIVLAHELAHVLRHDVRITVLARIACALNWINPLVWIAARRLRLEGERACDDLVLATGTRPASYAECLLDVARRARTGAGLAFPATEMARRSELEVRVRAILARDQSRAAAGRTTSRAIWFAALSVLIPLGAIRASETTRRAASEAPIATVDGTSDRCDCEQDRWPTIVEEDAAATARFLAGLRSHVAHERKEAVWGLGNAGTPEAAPALVAALTDSSEQVRQGAAAALGNLKAREAVRPLIASLDDPDDHVREAAIGALGALRDTLALRPLVRQLESRNEHLRQAAAAALGDLHDTGATSPLLAALQDPEKHVRQSAATALGRLGDRRAIVRLAALLEDPEPHVRAAAVQALGTLDAMTARTHILRLFATSDSPAVRLASARSLARLGDLRGLDLILRTLRDDPAPFTRRDAAWALGAIGPVPGVVEALRAAMHDESGYVRQAAACALQGFESLRPDAAR